MRNWIFVLALLAVFLMAPGIFAQEEAPASAPDGFSLAGPSDWSLKAMVGLSATTQGDMATGTGLLMTYGPLAHFRSGGSALVELGVLHAGMGVADGVDDREPFVASVGGGACMWARTLCLNADFDTTNGEPRVLLLLTPDLPFLR